MRIDRLTVAIRPRKHWEAADLGVHLLRDSQAEVLRLWCCLMAPLLAALVWLEHSTGRLIGLYVLWWLKPLLDYAVLWVLSRAVFGEKVTLGASLERGLCFVSALATKGLRRGGHSDADPVHHRNGCRCRGRWYVGIVACGQERCDDDCRHVHRVDAGHVALAEWSGRAQLTPRVHEDLDATV